MKVGFALGALGSASIAALAMPAAASAAVTISGSITDVVVPGDPGLAVTASPLPSFNFTLDAVGSVATVDVLEIGTTETTVNLMEDFAPRDVLATFTFLSPAGAGGTAVGSSSGFYRLFSTCGALFGGCGRVSWTNPTIISFGNGGSFSVTLSDVEFGTPGSATVSARFELLANAVPEPATWAMMILGFGVVGGALRGSRKTRARVVYA